MCLWCFEMEHMNKDIGIWTVTMRRLLYVILVWTSVLWRADSERPPVGRQLKSLRASPRPQKTRQPLPSCRASPLINGSSANHRLQSVDLSLLLLSPLYTLNFVFASRPIRFKLLKTHSSTLSVCRLQRRRAWVWGVWPLPLTRSVFLSGCGGLKLFALG